MEEKTHGEGGESEYSPATANVAVSIYIGKRETTQRVIKLEKINFRNMDK